jgi:phage tail sheath protein FI
MPEYLAPAVYVEETSFRSKSIEGVSTSTTGFVGPTLKGPVNETPTLLTSLNEFIRVYGGFEPLELEPGRRSDNLLAHSVAAFFNNGGGRLYVARAFTARGGSDGTASINVIAGANAAASAGFISRFPGAIGNGRITVTMQASPARGPAVGRAPEGTLLRIPGAGGAADTFFVRRPGGGFADTGGNAPPDPLGDTATFVTFNVLTRDAFGDETFYEGLSVGPGHPRYIGTVLAPTPGRRADQTEQLFAFSIGADVTAFQLANTFITNGQPYVLTGGNDGSEPGVVAYRAALGRFAPLEEISIVAAPGHSRYAEYPAIQQELISHAEEPRAYRIAVLDTSPDQPLVVVRDERSRIDSTRAALYYPWVIAANPLARPDDESVPREIAVPPSGYVCGIYARNDVQRGVFKAPANEVVRGALRFQSDVNFAQQQVLNPLGVNCLRYFPGRGLRVWGARTISSDPEWKYVNVRRYFNYLERSVDVSTQWAVFEPNGERLWANIRETVSGFLYNEFVTGALLGEKPEQAFFVRCDRSTMTQNDLDNGRLICLIGVAVLKPAEFVIFRIGQKTADARS